MFSKGKDQHICTSFSLARVCTSNTADLFDRKESEEDEGKSRRVLICTKKCPY